MGYQKVRFGNYENGSVLTFHARNIRAKQVPGTLKQISGKQLVKRNIVARDIWDWSIRVEGIFSGSSEQLEEFKDSINAMWGDKQYYNDGISKHEGSYLIEGNGFQVEEPPNRYDNDVILFTLELIEYNQV